MFPLQLVPEDLLPSVFDKMEDEQFLNVPKLDKFNRKVYEKNLHKFRQCPPHYLDKMSLERLAVRLPTLKPDYAKAMLKNLQSSSRSPAYFMVEFETVENLDVDEILSDLSIEILAYRRDDPNCLFFNANRSHIFPSNRAVFTMRNRKNAVLVVALRNFSLSVETLEEMEELLTTLWDATRNASCYPMPEICLLDKLDE